ncbi:MAG: hypothetical protein QGG34_16285 [SAR202 cluster bacterium]|nr:hypothetical protein [SAR202 cluster bacterium]MDP6300988.1 hypothetical protein [SAR202 cluster bacterium]MDP7290779.1 hypothetical protein [Verrucomicrobiota bacterium]MDP7534552.1 hypothetical protein [SAR202 cluster bacterium]HJO81314.1 hypothetical protein [SAR202 cluster bacterium]
MGDLDTSIDMNPTHADSFATRARVYAYLDNREMSVRDAVKALELGFDEETLDQFLDKFASLRQSIANA